MRFIIRTVAAAAALWVAMQFIDGIRVTAPENSAKYWGVLLLVALIFGIVNAIVKPIVKALGCAVIVLTLGLFLLVINAAMLLLTSWIAGQFDIPFHVDDFYPSAFWGAIIIS
ncbi:MAG: phage holin family protein, partial [Hamadaea sp.]|nr:phage holin family protein [Hamadaea sp.]